MGEVVIVAEEAVTAVVEVVMVAVVMDAHKVVAVMDNKAAMGVEEVTDIDAGETFVGKSRASICIRFSLSFPHDKLCFGFLPEFLFRLLFILHHFRIYRYFSK